MMDLIFWMEMLWTTPAVAVGVYVWWVTDWTIYGGGATCGWY